MSIQSELLALQERSKDGFLHASTVITWAKSHPKSALYAAIEWDDTKAADEYRLWQVRRLIQVHVVTEEGEPRLVSLSFDRPQGGGYRAIDDILADRSLSQAMLNDALKELDRVRRKYERVKELVSVWIEIEKVSSGRRKRQGESRVAV